MYLNDKERRDLLARCDADEEFYQTLIQLQTLLSMRYPDLVMTASVPLSASDIRHGNPLLLAVVVNPGQTREQVEAMAKGFTVEARELAHRLAAHFPEKDRWRWQERLFSMAISGNAFINPSAGRPTGSGTFQAADEFVAVVGDAVRALRAQGHHPTQTAVANHFAMNGNFPNCDERQLRRWAKDAGFADWQSLLESIAD